MRLIFNPLTGNFDYVGDGSSSSSGFFAQDEGINLGTGTILNFVGANVEASISGTVVRVFVTGSTGGSIIFPQEVIGLYGMDEGVGLGTGTTLSVAGSNIQLSITGSVLYLQHTDPDSSGFVTGSYTLLDGRYSFTGSVSFDLVGDILRKDAKAYWKMDEMGGIRLDSTRNNHNALIGVGNVNASIGKIGNALYNNVTTAYLAAEDHIDLSVPGAQNFSIAFWLRVSKIPSVDGFALLIAKNGQDGEIAYEVDLEGGAIQFYIAGEDLSYPTTSSPAVSLNRWMFVDAEFEYGTGLRLRIDNGAPITQLYTGSNIGLGSSADTVDIGRIFIDGAIEMDEVLFMKRVMNQQERDYLYNSGTARGLYPTTNDQVGLILLNNGVYLGSPNTLSVSGNRLGLSISGSSFDLFNSPDPQELIGIYGKDEGQNIGTGTILNVVGNNVSLSLSGTTLTLLHTDPDLSGFVTGSYTLLDGRYLPTGSASQFQPAGSYITGSYTLLNGKYQPSGTIFPQPVLGVMGWDDGVPRGTGTVVDFGDNLTASLSGTVLRVDASSSASLSGQDEGISLGTFSTINAVGSRLVASLSGTVLQLLASPDPIDNIGISIQNEGNFLATGTTLDIMGSVSVSGSIVNLRVPKTVSFMPSSTAGGVVFTNLVANDTTYMAAMVDLVGYTQCKLSGIFGAGTTATASGTVVHLMYATGSTFASLGELASSPNSEGAKLRWITSQQRNTPWFDINPVAAIADVGLFVRVTGGNGTADPSLLGLVAEFR